MPGRRPIYLKAAILLLVAAFLFSFGRWVIIHIPTGQDAQNAGDLCTELRIAFSEPEHPHYEPQIYIRPLMGAAEIVVRDKSLDPEEVLKKANALKSKYGIGSVSLSNE